MMHAPWLVFERDSAVIGYAYAGKHSERAAYDWSVDVSVYVHSAAHRGGVARALYTSLFSALVLQGFRNAYAGITLPNIPSVASMHRRASLRSASTRCRLQDGRVARRRVVRTPTGGAHRRSTEAPFIRAVPRRSVVPRAFALASPTRTLQVVTHRIQDLHDRQCINAAGRDSPEPAGDASRQGVVGLADREGCREESRLVHARRRLHARPEA